MTVLVRTDDDIARLYAGTDIVSLTPAATALADKLAAEWQATEAASAELPYPLSQVVRDMEEALSRRSFHDRIAARLAEDPAWR